MFRVFVSLAMAVLWTVVAHAQPANSRLDDIVKRGSLRVGMTGDYQPFTYFDKATSKFRGFDVDMAEALGKAATSRNSIRACSARCIRTSRSTLPRRPIGCSATSR